MVDNSGSTAACVEASDSRPQEHGTFTARLHDRKLRPASPLRRRNPDDAGNFAAGPIQTIDKAHFDRIAADSENNWNRSCCCFGSYRRVVGHCSNDRDSALDHIDSKRGKPISLTLGRSVLDYYVLAFDITDLAQALAELGQPTRVGFEWRGVEKRAHRYIRLLRPRSERPCCGTADHSNKVAPSHLPGPWLGTGIVTSNQETGRGQAVARRCPLWVKSRHSVEETRCPLYPQ